MMNKEIVYNRPTEQAVRKEIIGPDQVDVDSLPLVLVQAITSRAIGIMHRSN